MKTIGIVGIPFDKKSSFMRGSAGGPAAIREALTDGSSNFWTETGGQLVDGKHYEDTGDIEVHNFPTDILRGIDQRLKIHPNLITLGGDHSIAYPIIKSFSKVYPSLNVLQFDAHTDLYPDFEGDPHSHACPFRRIVEEGLITKLTQVGIRTIPEEHQAFANQSAIDIITMRDWCSGKKPVLEGPLYISLDLDVFDPGFAPGVSHYEPGGMTPREVLEYILDIKVPIVGADIVELNPKRDSHGMTAMVGAKFLKEIAGKMMFD